MTSLAEILIQLTMVSLGGVMLAWCFTPTLFYAAYGVMCGWP